MRLGKLRVAVAIVCCAIAAFLIVLSATAQDTSTKTAPP